MVALEFEQEEEDGRATGTLEKSFAGEKGTVDLAYDGQAVTDPTLADQVLAELTGIPTEAFFRSTASVRHHELGDLDRDEAPCAIASRRPSAAPTAGRVARKRSSRGHPRAHDEGRQEPGPAQGRGAGVGRRRPSSSRASSPWPSSSATATPCRARASAGPRPRRPSSSDGRCSRRPARPSASPPSATPPRSGTSATATRSRSRRARRRSHRRHPSPNPLPVLGQVVERLREARHRIRELRAALAGEVEV